MSLTLDVSIGTAYANSYKTDLETDQFALAMHSTDAAAWAALTTTAAKTPFLIRAGRILNTLPKYKGRRVNRVQAMEFPREGVPHPDGCGDYLSTEIPREAGDAQMQLAIWLAGRGTTGEDVFGLSGTANIKSLEVGSVALEFRDTSSNDGESYFWDSIAPILETGGLIHRQGRLTR